MPNALVPNPVQKMGTGTWQFTVENEEERDAWQLPRRRPYVGEVIIFQILNGVRLVCPIKNNRLNLVSNEKINMKTNNFFT